MSGRVIKATGPATPAGAPYRVVGYFKPHKLRGSVIGPALLAFTERLGLVPHADPVHGPQTTSIWCNELAHAEVRRFAQPAGQGRGWHQDGDLASGSAMDHAEVLWAATTPTQFKTADGEVWQPRPFQIVVARNLGCHHRTPPDAPVPPRRRWFFRQRIVVPSHLELP